MNVEKFKYDNRIVRAFAIATVIWGIVGMSAGLLAAIQLFWPDANLSLQYTTFGRLRPLHTNAVIFAFVGNGMFLGIYYSLQRLCKARMFSDKLSWVNFWGWNAIIVAAAITLPLGFTTSKEYAELEWPIDIAEAPGKASLCGNLVLYRNRDYRGGAPYNQLPGHTSRSIKKLFRICGSSGCPRAVVVWP
jgi:cbb3-type cytochrome oxidase subunit 1